ncbi:hypothetical protein ACFWIJ_14085 [Streptomyces sp. NPDC127079]|uniref:hypothetical protein n=1 Tax=Streptomyces sp. NPDC127079 TaxID=3347132 RepID=UPI00365747FD
MSNGDIFVGEVRSHWRKDAEWTAAMQASVREREFANWRKAVEKSFGWLDEDPG